MTGQEVSMSSFDVDCREISEGEAANECLPGTCLQVHFLRQRFDRGDS